VEGVARAAPAAATTNIIAKEKIFAMFFITSLLCKLNF
jgi:hypothetical protein